MEQELVFNFGASDEVFVVLILCNLKYTFTSDFKGLNFILFSDTFEYCLHLEFGMYFKRIDCSPQNSRGIARENTFLIFEHYLKVYS